MKYRNELKFILSKIDAELIKCTIDGACLRDEHANADGLYNIKSIYFDTITDKCLYETLDGVNTRHKYRVRRYDNNDNYFKFEKKLAESGLKCKEVDTISRELLDTILDGSNNGEYFSSKSQMKVVSDFMTENLLYMYRPVAVIGYTRRAYIYPIGNVRITFDSNIVVSEDINTFFDGYNGTEYSVLKDEVILEVKYDDMLPDFIRNILNVSGVLDQSAFSKYASARLIMDEGIV